MDPQALILILAFAMLLIIGMPVAFALGISTFLAVLSIGTLPAPLQVSRTMATGIDSFPLLAIPFFIVAGELMSGGGMARRLLILAEGMVGRTRGGLAYVNTISCMMFGAISGSAAAAVSSIGGIMIPQMERAGYKREFGVAVTATSATTGLVIPPSNIMIVYAVVAQNVSIAAIFLAGFIPGAIMGLALMAASFLVLVRRPVAMPAPTDADTTDQPVAGNVSDTTLSYATPTTPTVASPRSPFLQKLIRVFPPFKLIVRVLESPFVQKLIGAIPSLILIIIVLGGILGGAFSATEAAAIAVAYAFILGVLIYRELPLAALPDLLLRSAKTTGVVFLLIAASQAMAWILTRQQIPQAVADAMLSLSKSPIVLLLIINVTLLVVGTFMDMTPAVLIFTPIFLPVAVGLGMDPTHFGIVLIMNLCIGLCTPPVGTCLFIACGVGKTTMESASKAMVPFWIAMIAALLLVTYVPWFATFLPRLAGWM